MSFRIQPHPEAFTMSHGKKRPRMEDRKHLESIRALPCCICGKRPVEAAHIRAASPVWAKPMTGGGNKPDDKWTVPLCPDHHREQHEGSELAFWTRHRIDCFTLASALWVAKDDDEAQQQIIRLVRKP